MPRQKKKNEDLQKKKMCKSDKVMPLGKYPTHAHNIEPEM
jgi:hypothetical protein